MSTQRSSTAILLLPGGGFILLFGQSVLFSHSYYPRSPGFIRAGPGLTLVAPGGWVAQRGAPRWLSCLLDGAARRLPGTAWQAVCLGLAAGMTVIVPMAAGELGRMINPGVAVTAWGLALLLAVAGGWASAGPLRAPALSHFSLKSHVKPCG